MQQSGSSPASSAAWRPKTSDRDWNPWRLRAISSQVCCARENWKEESVSQWVPQWPCTGTGWNRLEGSTPSSIILPTITNWDVEFQMRGYRSPLRAVSSITTFRVIHGRVSFSTNCDGHARYEAAGPEGM